MNNKIGWKNIGTEADDDIAAMVEAAATAGGYNMSVISECKCHC